MDHRQVYGQRNHQQHHLKVMNRNHARQVQHWGRLVRWDHTGAGGLVDTLAGVGILVDEGHREFGHNRLGDMGSDQQVVDMFHVVVDHNLAVGSHKARENHRMIVVYGRHIAVAGNHLAEVGNPDRIGLVVESLHIAAAVGILHRNRRKSLGWTLRI